MDSTKEVVERKEMFIDAVWMNIYADERSGYVPFSWLQRMSHFAGFCYPERIQITALRVVPDAWQRKRRCDGEPPIFPNSQQRAETIGLPPNPL